MMNEKTWVLCVLVSLMMFNILTAGAEPSSGEITLTGEVIDAAEKPLSGVQVALVPSATSELSPLEMLTNDKGEFQFDYPIGHYEYIVLEKEGYARFADYIYNVRGNYDPEIQIPLQKSLYFSGRVARNLTNVPIEGAHVWAIASEANKKRLNGQLMFYTVTDASGHYRLEGLIPGHEFDVLADAPGLACGTKAKLRPGTGNLDFMLNQGASISGVVNNSDGERVPEVTIVIIKADGYSDISHSLYQFLGIRTDVYPSCRYVLKTDNEGKFSVSGLEQGSYKVAGYKDDLVALVKDRSSILPLSLAEDVENLEMFLTPGGEVSITVKNGETDEALPGAEVVLRFSDFNLEFMDGESDENGIAVFRGLANGKYEVKASLEGFTYDELEVTVSESGHVLEEIMLEPEKVLAGVVVNADGAPVSEAIVAHIKENRYSSWISRKVKSDAKGNFEINALPKGEVTIKSNAEGYATTLMANTETGDENLTIRLKEGGILKGLVSDSAGAPIEGATVALKPVTAMEDWAGKGNLQTTTTPGGTYRVTGLEPGFYTVRAYTNSRFCPFEKELTAASGKTSTLDFVLKPGIAISGEVVVCSVEDQSEAPIPGATVEVTHEGFDFKELVVTDEQGAFVIENIPEGVVRVKAKTNKGYSPKELSRVIYAPNEDIEGVKFAFKRAAGISGYVKNTELLPIGDATVSLNKNSLFMSRAEKDTVSDATGYFEFNTIDPGTECSLGVSAEGYASKRTEDYVLSEGEKKTDVEIILTKGGTISGRVTDVSGQALPDIGVSAMASISEAMSDHSKKEKTNSEGYYRIENVPAGQINVMCEPPDASSRFGMENLSKMFKGVLVREDQETANVDFRFDLPADNEEEEDKEDEKPTDRVSIKGKVIDENEQPISGASLTARPLDYSDMMKGSFGHDRTGTMGDFQLDDLAPGKYRVEVKTSDWFSAESVTTTAPEENLEIVLSRKGAISGVVIYKTNRQPITDFTIEVPGDNFEQRGMFSGFSSAKNRRFYSPHGEFMMESVEKGKHSFVFHVDGWASTKVENIEVKPGETTDGIVVEIGEGGRVTGIVLASADDNPVQGAKVNVSVAGANPALKMFGETEADRKAVKTDSDGLFYLENMNPGTVTIEVSHPEFALAKKSGIEILDGQESESIIVYLNQGGTLQGTVKSIDGNVLPNEGISAFTMDMAERYEATTNEEGFYQIKSMVPGNYSVMLGDFMNIVFKRSGVSSKTATIKEGEITELNFGDSGAMVHGQVTKNGQPVSDAQISVRTSVMPFGMDFSANGRSDEGGFYQIQGLEHGEYYVMLFGEGLGFYPLDRKQVEIPESAGAYEVNLMFPEGSVSGQVISATDGAPVVRAKVSMVPSDGGPLAQFAMMLSTLSTTTGTDGRFTLEEIPYDKYDLLARADGYGQESVEVNLFENPSISEVVVQLGGYGVIAGTVTDASTGEPLTPLVVVKTESGQSVNSTIENLMGQEKGSYSVQLSPGRYNITVQIMNNEIVYEPKVIEGIEVKPKETTTMNLKFAKGNGVNVSISFVDQNGGPVTGFAASIKDEQGQSYDSLCPQIGSLVAGVLPKGRRYTLSVTSGTYADLQQTIDLTQAGSAYSEQIVLERR